MSDSVITQLPLFTSKLAQKWVRFNNNLHWHLSRIRKCGRPLSRAILILKWRQEPMVSRCFSKPLQETLMNTRSTTLLAKLRTSFQMCKTINARLPIKIWQLWSQIYSIRIYRVWDFRPHCELGLLPEWNFVKRAIRKHNSRRWTFKATQIPLEW